MSRGSAAQIGGARVGAFEALAAACGAIVLLRRKFLVYFLVRLVMRPAL
jgi:hypothetical protein